MKVIRNRRDRTITLSQQAYVQQIVGQFGLANKRQVLTPMDSAQELWKSAEVDKTVIPLNKHESEIYRSMVGALLYAANITRIDIAYAVGNLCRYTSKACI